MTIVTEIAGQIKAALIAVLPKGTAVYADGIDDTGSSDGDEFVMPCVSVVMNECLPMQYRSVLRAYPGVIEVATWYPDDKSQEALYALSSPVSVWLSEPSLTLTLSHWDALTIDTVPERDSAGYIQFTRWQIDVKTRKA